MALFLTGIRLVGLVGAFAMLSPAVFADQYITGWVTGFSNYSDGGNNIYTDLNQQFPNTGSGTPGSHTGTANASYLYDPASFDPAGLIAGSDQVTNSVDFDLESNSTGQDFMQMTSNSLNITTIDGTNSLDIAGVSDVYLLTSAYIGVSYDVTFTGTGGASETFDGVSVPNFCGGGNLNTTSGGALDQSVLGVSDVGGCETGNSATGASANYYLYEQTFALNSSFTGQNLTGITIASSGYALDLFGVTVGADSVSPAPEPASMALLIAGLAAMGLLARRRNA